MNSSDATTELRTFDTWQLEAELREIAKTARQTAATLKHAQGRGIKQLDLPAKINGNNLAGLKHRLRDHAAAIRQALRSR